MQVRTCLRLPSLWPAWMLEPCCSARSARPGSARSTTAGATPPRRTYAVSKQPPLQLSCSQSGAAAATCRAHRAMVRGASRHVRVASVGMYGSPCVGAHRASVCGHVWGASRHMVGAHRARVQSAATDQRVGARPPTRQPCGSWSASSCGAVRRSAARCHSASRTAAAASASASRLSASTRAAASRAAAASAATARRSAAARASASAARAASAPRSVTCSADGLPCAAQT